MNAYKRNAWMLLRLWNQNKGIIYIQPTGIEKCIEMNRFCPPSGAARDAYMLIPRSYAAATNAWMLSGRTRY